MLRGWRVIIPQLIALISSAVAALNNSQPKSNNQPNMETNKESISNSSSDNVTEELVWNIAPIVVSYAVEKYEKQLIDIMSSEIPNNISIIGNEPCNLSMSSTEISTIEPKSISSCSSSPLFKGIITGSIAALFSNVLKLYKYRIFKVILSGSILGWISNRLKQYKKIVYIHVRNLETMNSYCKIDSFLSFLNQQFYNEYTFLLWTESIEGNKYGVVLECEYYQKATREEKFKHYNPNILYIISDGSESDFYNPKLFVINSTNQFVLQNRNKLKSHLESLL